MLVTVTMLSSPTFYFYNAIIANRQFAIFQKSYPIEPIEIPNSKVKLVEFEIPKSTAKMVKNRLPIVNLTVAEKPDAPDMACVTATHEDIKELSNIVTGVWRVVKVGV